MCVYPPSQRRTNYVKAKASPSVHRRLERLETFLSSGPGSTTQSPIAAGQNNPRENEGETITLSAPSNRQSSSQQWPSSLPMRPPGPLILAGAPSRPTPPVGISPAQSSRVFAAHSMSPTKGGATVFGRAGRAMTPPLTIATSPEDLDDSGLLPPEEEVTSIMFWPSQGPSLMCPT